MKLNVKIQQMEDARRAMEQANLWLMSLERWRWVDPNTYDGVLPVTALTVAINDSTLYAAGMPVKVAQPSGATMATTYYVVTAVTTSLLTLSGPNLDTAKPIAGIWVGRPEMTVHLTSGDVGVPGDYADSAASNIISSRAGRRVWWRKGNAYLVYATAYNTSNDTGANKPYVNPTCGGSLVLTDESNKGINVTTANTAGTGYNAANYGIVFGERVEIDVTQAGSNGDAANLSMDLVFVLE